MTSADALRDLGLTTDADGSALRVWSSSARSIDLLIYDDKDANWVAETVPLEKGDGDVWSGRSAAIRPGTRYGLSVDGPESAPVASGGPVLLDPYARGVVRVGRGNYRSQAVDGSFDWGDSSNPRTPLDRTVLYEAHVRGFSRRNEAVPEKERGSYAGLAHDSSIEALLSLGVTAVELLPVHVFRSEQRLVKQGLSNYWGYNTLGFFAPHQRYASPAAQADGPDAVLREFKTMVRRLHEAGLEVVLDVVYNHTAEEGPMGPTTSLRGIDDSYYRHDDEGGYVDTTGCGNTIDTSNPAAARLVLDSLRYWAEEVRVDGFRFDLAVSLARDAAHGYDREHPLLAAIASDPVLSRTKLISEPWDVGMGGWQVGNFPDGWHEWNDRYRDRVRNFWLSDVDYARRASQAPVGIGGFATRLAGSANTFSAERGPLASVNFVTAHDGFTLADLVSYDVKHNTGNGESNRDGSDNNRSFNHGTEGPTEDEGILAVRRKAMRNLLGTLLLSAGIPMLTAGDEYGRTQRGNNNAYCHDSELTWLSWEREAWQDELHAHAARLIRLRAENPALRPVRFARLGEVVPSASRMSWYDQSGSTMDQNDWDDARNRTLQYVAESTPETEEFNRILLIVHGNETPVSITLPAHEDVTRYELLWDSRDESPREPGEIRRPGDVVDVESTAMVLFRAHAD